MQTSEYVDYLETLNPGVKKNIEQTFFSAKDLSNKKMKKSPDTVHTIKVVFHVVHFTEEQNIDESLIHSQITALNNCFRRTNPDTINTRDIFKPIDADAGINFVLASGRS